MRNGKVPPDFPQLAIINTAMKDDTDMITAVSTLQDHLAYTEMLITR